jgi:hypothetical protein
VVAIVRAIVSGYAGRTARLQADAAPGPVIRAPLVDGVKLQAGKRSEKQFL